MIMSLEEARYRICQLDNAVQRLDTVRKNLMRNASEICGEIRSGISRNIDCLRNRELALLSEVDQVRLVKEETLQVQQGRLSQAINILRTAITLVQEDSASEKQLADTLERLNQLELSPEETPYISFRADQLQMRENLMNYGMVDANGLPLAIAFDNPGKPSASLPRHLEEYEDADHHVFYKTLQEIKKEPISTTSYQQIRVCFPKLSQRTEDWLQKKESRERMLASRPSTLTSAATPLVPSVASSQTFATNDSPSEPSPGNSCSLNNWLTLIKHHSDLEEEHDFEIIDNSCCKNKTIGQTMCSPSIHSDLQKWLNPSSGQSDPVASSLFDHIPKESRNWLLQISQQLASLEEMKVKDPFQHISTEPKSWLRSRAYTRHSSPSEPHSAPDFFSHISKDLSKWIRPHGKFTSTRSENDLSAMDGHLSPSKWLLQSNRRAQSQPCVMSISQQSAPYTLPPAQAQTSAVTWLLSPKQSAASANSQPTSQGLFSQIAPSGDGIWLQKLTEQNTHMETEDVNDDSIWLMKAQQSTRESNVNNLPNNVNNLAPATDLSNWLMLPAGKLEPEPVEMLEECEKESTDSCSWSICSSTHTVSSEQHAMDVAAATDYYNKWLL